MTVALGANPHMKRTAGFTLIELLTVIAIIAILAALIFPVFSLVKKNASRSADISSMNTLRSSLQLYAADQGGYPPALLGYVTLYGGGPDTVPADLTIGFLYPKRVDSISVFQPNLNIFKPLDTVNAVYPNQDPRPIGSAPIADLNGDGVIDSADDFPQARQAFGPLDGFVCENGLVDTLAGCDTVAQYYAVSGYDVAQIPIQGGDRFELRYTRFWTEWGLTTGSAFDDPRQLGYTNPPDSTVITWNSYFRDYESDGFTPYTGRQDIILFLGGSARAYSTPMIFERSYRVMP